MKPLVPVLSSLLLLGAGCVGEIPGAPATLPAPPGQTDSDPNADLPPPADDCVPAPLPARRIMKLSDPQYVNAVADLVGTSGAANDVRTPGSTTQAFVNAHELDRVDGALASQFQRAAESVAADAVKRIAAIFPCPTGPSATAADPCARTWIEGFVGRAYRRPLTADEIGDYGNLFQAGAASGVAGGVRLVVEAALQAPSFLYRSELGAAPARGRVALTDHELAAQLSFWLTDGPPDATLRAAAAAGKLSDPDGLRAEMDRLLGLALVRQKVDQGFLRLFQLPQLLDAEKDPKQFPSFAVARPSLVESARLFIDDIVWGGDLAALYTSRTVFADGKVAPFYGVSVITGKGFQKAMAPQGRRAGILTHPAFLAHFASPTETQIVQRGLFVRSQVLCQSLAPPEGVDTATLVKGLTPRQAVVFRAGQAKCASCHNLIDPFGVMFELYGPTGVYRTSLGGQPIDSAAQAAGTDFDGPLASAVELAERLGQSQQASSCLVNQLLSWSLARTLQPRDSCGLSRIERAHRLSGGLGPAQFMRIALSDEFRFRQP